VRSDRPGVRVGLSGRRRGRHVRRGRLLLRHLDLVEGDRDPLLADSKETADINDRGPVLPSGWRTRSATSPILSLSVPYSSWPMMSLARIWSALKLTNPAPLGTAFA
jgi:hypothetical protein